MERLGTRTERAEQVVRRYQPLFIMTVLIIVLGAFLIYPGLIMLVQSFNVTRDIFVGPFHWGLDNWIDAFQTRGILISLWNSLMVFSLMMLFSFPPAILIAWVLARTRIPFSYGLEFLFWVAFMMPNISIVIGWLLLGDKNVGILNAGLKLLPLVESGPINITSVPGIVWVSIMANGVASQVMLLTPAFRNMDAALEEAGRVSGASTVRTMFRVTFPVMIPPITVVLALQVVRMFQSFEIEQILGTPIGFYVYSTKIFQLVRTSSPPNYGEGTALASLTLLIIAVIIPVQRWLITRRQYTTVTGNIRPGLIDLGRWCYPAFIGIVVVLFLLIVAPAISLILGSFMTLAGFFDAKPVFTTKHWELVLGDALFLRSLRNTFFLATTTAVISPILFSMIAYILVRTKWRGRGTLDWIIWISGAIPGILSGLGLLFMFLGTPGLSIIYGTIWALVIVTLLQGNTVGVQMAKGVFTQMGADLEEQARISGAGWIGAYFKVWVPILMPTLILLATINFVLAANTTSSIVLLATRDTQTLSLLALELASPEVGQREAAGIVSIVIIALTLGMALLARAFGLRLGIQHR